MLNHPRWEVATLRKIAWTGQAATKRLMKREN